MPSHHGDVISSFNDLGALLGLDLSGLKAASALKRVDSLRGSNRKVMSPPRPSGAAQPLPGPTG